MAIATSQTVGVALLRALGIPTERCEKAVITLEPGKPVRIEATYFTVVPGDGEIDLAVQGYKVVEIDE